MKRSKTKPAETVIEVPAKNKHISGTPVEIAQIRKEITRLVGEGAVQMVEKTIEQVESGHYLAMKYLFEMVGLYPATAPQEPGEQDSLTKILLRNLGIPEGTGVSEVSLQTKVSKDLLSPADEALGHVVE